MQRKGSPNLVVVLLLLVAGTASDGRCQDRSFSVDDLFELRSLAAIAPSPSGGTVAVVVQRPWNDPLTFRPYGMAGFDHSDLWLIDTESGEIDDVTRGSLDGSGYWNPVWSRDGRTLALLSTRGGENVRLYTLDVASRRLRRATDQGVDLRSGHFGPASWRNPLLNELPNLVHWLDANRLLVTLLPSGEQPEQLRLQTVDLAAHAWRDALDGTTPTASVLDTDDPSPSPASQLALVDLSDGSQRVIVEGDIRDVQVSPDGGHAMVIAGVSDSSGASSASHLGLIASRANRRSHG